MSKLPVLPEPLEEVEVPEYFSPSSFSRLLACPVSAMAHGGPTLPSGPAAYLGSVLHRLVEDAARGRIDCAGTPEEACRQHLKDLQRALDERLAADAATLHLAPLDGALSYDERKKRELVALQHAVSRWKPFAGNASGDVPAEAQPLVGERGVEAPLRSSALRLRGTIDAWERNDGTLVLYDLKTGRLDAASESVQLQLRLYGLLALEHGSGTSVRLVVSKKADQEIAFGAVEEAEIRRRLEEVLADYPTGQKIDAVAAARPGEACRYCRVRHRCSPYLEAARAWWQDAPDYALPLDTWGQVRRVRLTKTKARVQLIDAAERAVVVRRLDRGRYDYSGLTEGMRLAFFGLLKDATMAEAHPSILAEVAAPPVRRRAFDAAVFLLSKSM